MPVYLDAIRFINPLSNGTVDWLLANVGDPLVIEHDISVKLYSASSSNSVARINSTNGYFYPGVVTGFDFSLFNVGDIVNFHDYSANSTHGNYTIIEKYDSSSVRFNSNIGGYGNDTDVANVVISLVSPITSISYKWNWIENQEAQNYFSKIDGFEHLASVGGLNPGNGGIGIPMPFIGSSPCGQIGSVVIDEVALEDPDLNPTTIPIYSSKFKITHTTYITPFILAQQYDDLKLDVAPDYFLNLNCLRAVFYYEARYNNNDPNRIQTFEKVNLLGNTGWFNENWNTGLSNYFTSGLVYKNQLSVIIPQPILSTNLTSFSFNLTAMNGKTFTAGRTKIIMNFAKVPNDESEYTQNTRDLKNNFLWETAIIQVEVSPSNVNGDHFSISSPIQSLSKLKAAYVDATTVRIEGEINLLQSGIDIYKESDEPRYIFWLSTQDHDLNANVSDRVSVLIDANPFYFQTQYPNLITFETKLIPHTINDYVTPFTPRDTFSEDELVAYTKIEVGKTVESSFIRGTCKIVARNTVTGEEFALETCNLNVSGSQIANSLAVFNIVQPKNIHVPSTEIRKNIVFRNIGTDANYEFAYPFLNRWEYWVQVLNANPFFYDQNKPLNGFSEDWVNYFQSDWTLSVKFEFVLSILGIPNTYTDYLDFPIFDRNLDDENIVGRIKTYDPDTGNELITIGPGGAKYILGYKPTLIRCLFEDFHHVLDEGVEAVVFGVEIFEEGGISGKRRMSSKYVSDSDTWFIPLPGETKVKITNPTSNRLLAEVYLDHNAIGALLGKSKWKLTCRLYRDQESLDNSTIGITDGYGYLVSQDVSLIANNPVTETTVVVTPKESDCGTDEVWSVLADALSSDPLRNDVNRFINWFDKSSINSAKIFLVKCDGSEYDLTSNSTYGTPFNYGFQVNGQNEKLIGYEIEWRKVLLTLGAGSYNIRYDVTDIFGGGQSFSSEVYCLKQYTDQRAEGTVRVEYYLSGILGLNNDDTKYKDLVDLNWYNSHRFEGVFSFTESVYSKEEIQYQTGLKSPVEFTQEPEYLLSLKPIPFFKHNVLRTDIIMADQILITDYNSSNIEGYFKKNVSSSGSYTPKTYIKRSKLASVELKFKQGYNNLSKFRS